MRIINPSQVARQSPVTDPLLQRVIHWEFIDEGALETGLCAMVQMAVDYLRG